MCDHDKLDRRLNEFFSERHFEEWIPEPRIESLETGLRNFAHALAFALDGEEAAENPLEKSTEDEAAEAPAESSGGSKILRGLAKGIFCLALSLLMIHVIKPMYYQYIDASAAQEMTDGQKQEAMGLPLKMTKPPKGKKSNWSREELRWMAFMDIKLDELKACVNE